jgi:hypothetical protein
LPGVYITTAVNKGSGVRPSEVSDLLTAQGLVLERPIKVGITLGVV